jgi:hypothetical protein
MASAAMMLLWCAGAQNAAAPPIAARVAPIATAPVDTAPLEFLLEVPNHRLLATTPRLDTAFLSATAATGGPR